MWRLHTDQGHRSEPQMQVAASLMMASVASRMFGIGMSSTVMLPGSCMMTARMFLLVIGELAVGQQ